MKLAAYFLFKGDVKLPLIITRCYDMSEGARRGEGRTTLFVGKNVNPWLEPSYLKVPPISAGADVDK